MNRTKELMQHAEQQDKVMFQELAKLYDETFKDVQKEIFAFYAKYAEDNKITIQEAKQRLRRTDLSDYRENARRYREEVKTPELLERLNEQYVSSKATRLDALKLDLTYQLGLLEGKVSGSFDSYLKKLAKHSYRKISGGLSDSTLNEPALEQLVKTPFEGYNYSQQVWGNVDHLARDLHKTLTRGFVKGFSPHEMATEIRKRHDVARHRAETLVRTDGSMVINNATLKRYKDVGLKFYRIHVHIDSRTSDICMNISKLDKAYKLSEAQPGYNMPPLHPNCRSTIVPDDEDMDRADDRDVEEVRKLLEEEKSEEYNKGNTSGAVYGAWNDKNDPLLDKRLSHAYRYYQSVLNRDKEIEISKVAENTGFKTALINDIYDHIFVNNHRFEDGTTSKFDPSYDMANSWQRLREGKNIQDHDLVMLEHEYFEVVLMGKENMAYEEAHEEANKIYNYAKEVRKFNAKNEKDV